MCHDISFSANTVEFITEILPDAIWDGQAAIDFSTTAHVLSMSHRKCVVVYRREGQAHINIFEWGLVADFMYTPELVKKYRIQMANARSEKIFDKRSAWYRVRRQRCLVAVNGFYEHRAIKGWKNKVPYYISLQSGLPMLLPAFYHYSPLPDVETGEMPGTFAIITRPANALMRQIHNHGPNQHRMPLLMQPEAALRWIQDDLSDEAIQSFLDDEIPSDQLDACPVYTIRSAKPRPDGKEKFEFFQWENLPGLGNDEAIPPQSSLF